MGLDIDLITTQDGQSHKRRKPKDNASSSISKHKKSTKVKSVVILEAVTTFFSATRDERRVKKFFSEELRSLSPVEKNRVIYVDAIQTPNSLIGLSYFLPELQKKKRGKIVAYRHINSKPYNFATNKIRHYFSVLKSLGVNEIEIFKHKSFISEETRMEFSQIKNKKDLETYRFHDIYIGDLIYDSYLNEMTAPSLDLSDPNLVRIFARCLEMVSYWEAKIAREEVVAVCVNHAVYSRGIPARVAIHHGIEVFQVMTESVYRLSENHLLAHQDYFNYPEEFAKFSAEFKSKARDKSRVKLEKRLSGELTSDLFYMPKSAFAKSQGQKKAQLKPSNKKKILIATHDFYDSPHCCGNSLFTDFLEWLEALGKISNESNLEWYIKNHPYTRGKGMEVVSDFLKRYPNITYVDSDTSHHQLIDEGISFVTTVFGSVALEYSYLGFPVVNACPTNPHFRYGFSLTPESVIEYNGIIRNLESRSFSWNPDEILEFYYMHFLHYPQNWVFQDYGYYLECTSGEGRNSLLKTYEHFLESDNVKPKSDIIQSIELFLGSKEYRLRIE